MRKFLAIYVSDANRQYAVWEFPLGPFARQYDDAELLEFVKKDCEWFDFSDLEEPEGWRDFTMHIRSY